MTAGCSQALGVALLAGLLLAGTVAAQTLVPRATLVLEPPVLSIGDVASIEIAVVTPPGHRLLPVAPPEIPGAWVLQTAPPEVERSAERWIHRVKLRVRPRDVGSHRWPAMHLVVEDASGERTSLEVEERSIDVVSVWPTFPEQREPFGLQSLRVAAPGSLSTLLLGMGLGALASVLLLAGGSVLRRLRGRPARRRGEPDDDAPHEWARAALVALERDVDRDPQAAATAAASVLRGYLDRRYGADVRAATTGELERGAPVWFLRSRWRDFLTVIHALDDARFRPVDSAGAESAEGVRAALRGARDWVARGARPDRAQTASVEEA